MAISTIKATIQMRKGLERDFDADQMTAGEWAVSTDTKYVRMCFAPGIVLRMATYEGFEVDMEEIRDILNECQDIQTAVDAMSKLAEKHKNDSEKSAKLSESWAKGETGIRAGENTNNSKYFSDLANVLVAEAEKLLDQAQKVITASTQGALIPGGTVAFQDLPTNPAVGFMYNISNDFTTDNRFEDGAGIFYRAGANVYWTSGGKWDVLIGTQVTGVKGENESIYRLGNVNLTPENIGAVATNGDGSYITVEFPQEGESGNIKSGDPLGVSFGKLARMHSVQPNAFQSSMAIRPTALSWLKIAKLPKSAMLRNDIPDSETLTISFSCTPEDGSGVYDQACKFVITETWAGSKARVLNSTHVRAAVVTQVRKVYDDEEQMYYLELEVNVPSCPCRLDISFESGAAPWEPIESIQFDTGGG